MRRLGWAVVFGVFLWTGSAAADAAADRARAAGAADAASITARRLRKQWDQVRSTNAAAASCVEDKVAQAIALSNRVERRRIELYEATDDKARAAALSAIEVLDAHRLELEGEANVCVHGKPVVLPKLGTEVKTKIDPKLPPDSRERELQLLLMSLPMLGR